MDKSITNPHRIKEMETEFSIHKKFSLISPYRINVDNQVLKPGFTSREIVILENDDPGGVFEFSPVSKGPWFINVRQISKVSKNRFYVFNMWVVDAELRRMKKKHIVCFCK